MKKFCIFIIMITNWAILSVAHAQELTVKSMKVAPMDLSASQYERKDLAGQACGLVKVQLATTGATFEGNVIRPVENKAGEYWVYMSEGSYMLSVKHPSFIPLDVNFRDYGIQGVQGKATYKLTLLMPQAGVVNVDDGLRYLKLTVTPKNSKVTVDGVIQEVDENGFVGVLLPPGSHRYQVEARGYTAKTGQVTIAGESIEERVVLESALATVRVSCPTGGAQIYVDDKLMGTSPWSGSLAAGIHRIEGRLTGYCSQRVSETIGERETRQIEIPALQAILGNLNVTYKPSQSEVWVDGKRLGTTPDIFRNLLVGQHEVEIRKEGYASKKERVTIAEGQTYALSGSLEPMSVSQASTSVSPSSGSGVETITVNGVSFNMVRVDGGTFQMGATSEQKDPFDWEKPVHRVTLSDYYIGETEVTQGLWEAVMDSNPSEFKGKNLPVECVSWDDCQIFIQKLNQLTGRRFRLPTEAEWEYASRGGNRSRGYQYSGSNNLNDVAWYTDNSKDKTHDVKTKQSNELGLYDMSGNVWEWCQDWYGDYSSSAQTNPTGPSSGSRRVDRGGCWSNLAGTCRVSRRNGGTPGHRNDGLGLRLAL